MKEKFGGPDPEGDDPDPEAGPTVPVPDDFPDEVIVTRPPGLSIEEQRRAAQEEGDRWINRHDLSNPITRHS